MNTKFKPGTMVLLVKTEGDVTSRFPNVGAVGEVIDPTPFLHEIKINNIVVSFPNHKSKSKSGYWNMKASWVIPLNDGDLNEDLCNEDTPIKEKSPCGSC